MLRNLTNTGSKLRGFGHSALNLSGGSKGIVSLVTTTNSPRQPPTHHHHRLPRRSLYGYISESRRHMMSSSGGESRGMSGGGGGARGMFSGGDVVGAQGKLLEKVMEIVMREKLVTGMDTSSKVVEFKDPEELKRLLQLKIGREGSTLEEAGEVLERITKYSVKTQHPHHYNQLYGGIDEGALAGAWLTEALNTNQHTYEVAPVFTLVEHHLVAWLVERLGWQQGDGIFSPGGSMSNMYGMVLARYRRYPEVKKKGVSAMKPLVVFTSDQSHYSIGKAASWMGVGVDNVIAVESDRCGRMLPGALKEAVKAARDRGGDPFFVNATAGTTVLGSFDPLGPLADVCEEEGLWLHVDACWGGTALLSKKHRYNIDGIERSDSVAWNPHKMLGASLQCSAFVVKHKGLLHESNSASATYLFQQDKFYDVSYDSGDKSFQCGRKVDAFKLYFLLAYHGLEELERRVDAAFSASRYLSEEVKRRDGFRQVLEEPQCTNTCFWFIPPSLRGQKETQQWWDNMAKVAPKIKERMVRSGTMMIGYQPVKEKGLVNFFRLVNTCYPTPTRQQMDQVLEQIEQLGADL